MRLEVLGAFEGHWFFPCLFDAIETARLPVGAVTHELEGSSREAPWTHQAQGPTPRVAWDCVEASELGHGSERRRAAPVVVGEVGVDHAPSAQKRRASLADPRGRSLPRANGNEHSKHGRDE